MAFVRVSAAGRVVIPAHIRRVLGIGPGTCLEVEVEDGAVLLRPIHEDPISRAYGMLRDLPGLVDDLLAERARDCEREEEGLPEPAQGAVG